MRRVRLTGEILAGTLGGIGIGMVITRGLIERWDVSTGTVGLLGLIIAPLGGFWAFGLQNRNASAEAANRS